MSVEYAAEGSRRNKLFHRLQESRATSRPHLACRLVRPAGVCSLNSFLADWKLTLALLCAVVAAIAMIAYAFIRPAVDPEEDERKRRLHLNQIGRIAEGQVGALVQHPPEPPAAPKSLV